MEALVSLFWLPVSLLILFIDLCVIVSVSRSQESTAVKAVWSAGIIVFPVLGLIAWAVAGPRAAAHSDIR